MKLAELKEQAKEAWATHRQPGIDGVDMPDKFFENYFKQHVLDSFQWVEELLLNAEVEKSEAYNEQVKDVEINLKELMDMMVKLGDG